MDKEIIDIIKRYGFVPAHKGFDNGDRPNYYKKEITVANGRSVMIGFERAADIFTRDRYNIWISSAVPIVQTSLTERQVKTDFKCCLDEICQEFIDQTTRFVAAVAEYKMTGI